MPRYTGIDFPNAVDCNNILETSVYDTGVGTVTNNPCPNGLLLTYSGGYGKAYFGKQIWFRWGTVGSNDFQTFVRTRWGDELSDDGIQYGSWYSYVVYDHISSLIPNTDNSATLGNASKRFKQLFAGTATINTSDEREKSSIENIPDQILDAWNDVQFCQYQFNDAIEEKGESARIHNGLIAQRIDNIFKERGLDISRYGLFCHDETPAIPELLDDDGSVIQKAREAGDRYSLRYEEALCMEAAYQRRENRRLKDRVSELENKVLQLEDKLNQLLNK